MALSTLYHQGIVHHVVSQNCDGLHLRSGLPKSALSEVHGNMYIEVCIHCVPAREYVRTMDVTEKTSTFKHTTGRRCYRWGLTVLKKYPWLWQMGRSPKKRPRLYIVNLQWTPKDKDATLKINVPKLLCVYSIPPQSNTELAFFQASVTK
ncbi:NAD-dependent protein deacetylase sirtuin-7 [Portunus trituberculatus]|uniref:Regulatory protein SIR2 homolog 7 n=1 Tax=Portunus trituberculatus TaxID=210409 RepID=A0A5B7CU42_PORTR|nr:NAD-dependent protein deacetylase sirtuin-7 [Portunus trituberculatus]